MAGEPPPLSRKELAQQAKLDEIKSIQEKQNKAARAKAKSKKRVPDDDQAETAEELPPTQADVLPRFPAPQKPAAPSRRELDEMTISHELKDAVLVDQSRSFGIQELLDRHSPSLLSLPILARLKELDIESFFAVQAAVLPILLSDRSLYSPRNPPRDLCVSAPTGSGKTLGYVIPIVEVRRLART